MGCWGARGRRPQDLPASAGGPRSRGHRHPQPGSERPHFLHMIPVWVFQFIEHTAGMSKGGDLNETPRGNTHRKLRSGQQSGLISPWHEPRAEGQAKRRRAGRAAAEEGRGSSPRAALPLVAFLTKLYVPFRVGHFSPCFWSIDLTITNQLQKAGKRPWLPSPALRKDLLAVPCCTEVSCYEDFIIITERAAELHHK